MTLRSLTFLFASATLSAVALADAPAIQSVAVYPDKIDLTTQRARQSLVVQAKLANGITRDVTAEAAFTLADPSLAKLDGGWIYPTKDGATELTIAYAGQQLKVPVKVAKAAEERPISFRLDVIPVFTKSTCNNGSCHGASRGKDGFNLSLFGYDPAGDHYRITRQQVGRRIDLAVPHASLMLTKSTGEAQHTGGQLFTKDSELYATILRWLEAGAPDDPADVAKVTGIEVLPNRFVLESGDKHGLTVIASYSDGTTRDVTRMAALTSNNESSAKISPEGLITADQRGEAFVFARFDKFTVGGQTIVIPRDLQYTWPGVPENNYVDQLVNAKLQKLRILPAELCTDEQFLRRVSIDITGTLPTPEQYAAFIADTDPKKREKVVDTLLERKEFVEIWVMKFAELLQIRSGSVGQPNVISYKAAVLYYGWLQEQLANNVPINKIVQDLLSGSGGTFTSPATNFYQLERDTKKLAENVAQVFMGMRIQCAQCHNHPFDRWTMDDYYSFVAFFSQVGRKQAEDPRDTIVFNAGGGEINHPVGGRVMPPKFLGGATPALNADRRKLLAEWLASPENPYFAKNMANIVWAHFYGRGITEPVDDVRVSNPPSNPELLDELGRKFTEYNYDFKKLVRDICTSRTYQLSTQVNDTNKLDVRNFSHAAVRRMRAEVLFDAISQATNTRPQNKFTGLPQGARAVQIADGNVSTYFLTTFGRASRGTVCSCEVKMDPNLSQALHLMNGDTVDQKIAAGGVVKALLDAGKTPDQIAEHLYVACFSRKPTAEELAEVQKQLAAEAPENKQQFFEDVFWALLNTKEFMFNH